MTAAFSAPGLPLPHEYGDRADWPAVLLERLQAQGCRVEADAECLRVSSPGPLPVWDAQLLRIWAEDPAPPAAGARRVMVLHLLFSLIRAALSRTRA